MNANAAKSRKRKPLRDLQPIARLAHQDSTLVLGDRLASPEFRKRYELLKATVQRVVLRGGLHSLTSNGKPSALLNDLIEGATLEGLQLLRPQITACELLHSDMNEALALTLYPLSDAEMVRRAKCIADKAVKDQKIISRRAKRDEAGNILRDDKGRAKRGYQCVGLRIEHPTPSRDAEGNREWSSPVGEVAGMDGRPINGGRTTNYSHAAMNEMVNKFQKGLLLETLAGYLGRDDAEFLMDWAEGRFDSEVADEMAAFFIECLTPHRSELEQFRDLLT